MGDWESAISKHPMSSCGPDDLRPFLQWKLIVNIDGTQEYNVGFGNPDNIHLAKFARVHVFIDCTFKCVPKGFTQCMILMIYSPATQMYVPIFWTLLQSKKQAAYYHALQMMICASNWQLEALTYTADFEVGLMNAIKLQFPEGKGLFCLFHWKQAIRRHDYTIYMILNDPMLQNDPTLYLEHIGSFFGKLI
jgi:hypothetical protein